MARQLEPWQRGYIPPVKPPKNAAALAPEPPPGWEQDAAMGDAWRYTYSVPWRGDFAIIVGGVSKPWRLYRGPQFSWVHDEIIPESARGPAMESKCLKTVARWWAIEVSLMPEPAQSDNPFGDSFVTQSGRQTGKHAALGMGYGGGKTALQIGNVLHGSIGTIEGVKILTDFKTIEDRAAAALTHKNGAQADIYAELLKYCMADVTGGNKP